MKYLIAIMLIFVSLTSNAEPFKLEVVPNGNSNYVIYDPNDWIFITSEDQYHVYLAKGEKAVSENGWIFITGMTVLDKPMKYDFMIKPITSIFSYGAIDCQNKKLYLLGDLFSSHDHEVQYIQYHEIGNYISNLDIEGTARNEVWKVVCNKSI
jgi:hypothetical protein